MKKKKWDVRKIYGGKSGSGEEHEQEEVHDDDDDCDDGDVKIKDKVGEVGQDQKKTSNNYGRRKKL